MVWDEQQWRDAHLRVFGHGPEQRARIVADALIADAQVRWGHEYAAVGWIHDGDSPDLLGQVAALLTQAAREHSRLVDDLTFCQIAPSARSAPHDVGVVRALACIHPADGYPKGPDPDRKHSCPESGVAGVSVISVEQRFAAVTRKPPLDPEPWRLWRLTPDMPFTTIHDSGFNDYTCPECLGRDEHEFVAAMPDCSDPAAGVWMMCRCGQSQLGHTARYWLRGADYMVVTAEDFLPACHEAGFGPLSRPVGALDGRQREPVADRWAASVLPAASIGGDRRWRICARVAAEAISARTPGLERSQDSCKALALAALVLATTWDGTDPQPTEHDLLTALAAGSDTLYERIPELWKTVEAEPVLGQNRIYDGWVRNWPAGFMQQSGIGSIGMADNVAWMRIILPTAGPAESAPYVITPEQTRQALEGAYRTLRTWFDAEIITLEQQPKAGTGTSNSDQAHG